MNPEVFAEWLRRQGYYVAQTESSYWYNQGPGVYQAFPYHWLIEPSEKEISQFLSDHKVAGLRYSSPLSASIGKVSYHVTYESPTYGNDDLSKWARKNVRRGNRNCKISTISFERLADEGWELQLDTLNRQRRGININNDNWRQMCLSASDLPGFEAWGALVSGKVVASVITFQMSDTAYLLYQQCLRQFLVDHVNNALSFFVTKELVNRVEVNEVLYGLHSLDAPPSVDEFKFRMGYMAKPVRQRVVFHPALAPIMNFFSYKIVQVLAKTFSKSPFLSKSEGMMRFYRQWQRPLNEQNWPPPLENMNSCFPDQFHG